MEIDTLLMTPGPVHLDAEVTLAGARALTHHRTNDFAPVYTECVTLLKKFFGTTQKLYLTTSSGTGAMETAIANLFNEGETVLTVQTGVFGVRFTRICEAFRLKTVVLACEDGKRVTVEQIAAALEKNPEISGVTVTFNETSTGIRNDIEAIGKFLKDKGKIFITDGVSGIGALPFKMDEWHVDVAVSASQKGFLAPPGVGMVALSEKAWAKVEQVKCHGYYFDLKIYKKDQEGAIPAYPWTPAINVMFSLLEALRKIDRIGIENCFKHYEKLAGGLRAALKAMNLRLFTDEDATSNVLTVFYSPEGVAPKDIVSELRNRYGVLIAGGQEQFATKLLRITTIGAIGERDILGTVGLLEMTLKKSGYLKQVGAGISATMEYFLNYK
ncbi:MAG: alanine--glyoxylate aminotransferase family protein [Candidatus Riflebacteria bacterium]|nr:alanine--glyoxylate aminotransferase family protein [Candidatus Riflebacteria bacterium]